MKIVNTSLKGQLIIPIKLRKKLGIIPELSILAKRTNTILSTPTLGLVFVHVYCLPAFAVPDQNGSSHAGYT